jgi:hypothetical protein
MSDNVIQLDDLRITRRKHNPYLPTSKQCPHLNLTMDDHGQCVECDDCGAQLSAYWVLNMFRDRYEKAFTQLGHKEQRLEQLRQDNLHLIAAKKVEAVWRKRDVLPCCPHCGEGIAASDGLGETMIGKRIDDARRAARKAAQTSKKE